jgi:hypothetical protein
MSLVSPPTEEQAPQRAALPAPQSQNQSLVQCSIIFGGERRFVRCRPSTQLGRVVHTLNTSNPPAFNTPVSFQEHYLLLCSCLYEEHVFVHGSEEFGIDGGEEFLVWPKQNFLLQSAQDAYTQFCQQRAASLRV